MNTNTKHKHEHEPNTPMEPNTGQTLVALKRGTRNAGSGTQLKTQTQNAKHVCNGITLERTKRMLKTHSSL